jgi:flagellar biosynthesis/type III secretory pathway protein FliH
MVKELENDLWKDFSTYSVITAEQLLERYGVKLQRDELATALKDPNNFYHRLLRLPLKNVFNGIILQQAQEYRVFAQKSFIDYLLSGEASKPEEAAGGPVRDNLEEERKALVKKGEEFHKTESARNTLIAESQQSLLQQSKELQKTLVEMAKEIKKDFQASGINLDEKTIIEAINALLIQSSFSPGKTIRIEEYDWSRIEQILGQSLPAELKQAFVKQLPKLEELNSKIDDSIERFTGKISNMTLELRKWRSDFYDTIIRLNKLTSTLPEYTKDQAQIQENREALVFDPSIGEPS